MPAAIEFRSTSFATEQGRLLLDQITLTVEEGTTMVLLGRSGSGKTTLLRTVNRMVETTSGEVRVHGEQVERGDPVTLRRGIGYVIQETGLFPHFTIERNTGLVLEAAGQSRDARRKRSYELLALSGLDPATFAHRFPHQLSGGQRQRAGLARALAADPAILLMDEPFGALDPLTRAEMQDMLLGILAQMKKTVLLVTPDLNEALYLGDRIALLDEGRLVAVLSPAEFLASGDERVQRYVQAYDRGTEHSRGVRQ